MKRRFQGLSVNPIHVVENGVEEFDGARAVRLRGVSADKKVVGYTGSLRDRIDVDLILAVADQVDDVHVLLVGPTGGNRDVERLRLHPNISMTGALSYERSREIVAGFDVGIIPHTIDGLTDSMNPLKFYLYKQLGVPIVATPVKNLGSFEGSLYFSDGTIESFVQEVRMAIKRKRSLRPIWGRRGRSDLWSNRVESIRRICGL